jgi:hypothetical protein
MVLLLNKVTNIIFYAFCFKLFLNVNTLIFLSYNINNFKSSLFFQCDLIPAWATKGWLRVLSKEYPTLAFHASINKSFGKVNY